MHVYVTEHNKGITKPIKSADKSAHQIHWPILSFVTS